jgi:hypothetical protein
MIRNNLFYCKNKDTYPPFKKGLYLEEYFLDFIKRNNYQTSKKYIPALWTNFQIEGWFRQNDKKVEMQKSLDEWLLENESKNGYYTLVQYDDGPLLNIPKNTDIYGACSGTHILPLIYQDTNNTLLSMSKKSFNEKSILCSFVGNITSNNVLPNVRKVMFDTFKFNGKFKMINSGGWTPAVKKVMQDTFINTTIDSKFALSPRGYGRSSFRFFECYQLHTIPIYLWNDIEWLPFKDEIDYSKICVSLHISKINELENILSNITEEEYNNMFIEYEKIKHLFELEGMCEKIITLV